MMGHIGVTGVMTPYEIMAIRGVADVARQARGSSAIRVGILASEKTLRGEANKYPRRYPPRQQIRQLVEQIHAFDFCLRPVLHVAADDPTDCARVFEAAIGWAGPLCSDFQVNVPWPEAAELRPLRDQPDARVVLQVGPRAIAEMRALARIDGAGPLTEKDAELIGELVQLRYPGGWVHEVLLDVSGGCGEPFPLENAAAIIGAFRSTLRREIAIGIAGGLSPENVHALRPLFAAHPRIAIDAETELRDRAPGGGDLAIERVAAYVIGALDAADLRPATPRAAWSQLGWVLRAFRRGQVVKARGPRGDIDPFIAAAARDLGEPVEGVDFTVHGAAHARL